MRKGLGCRPQHGAVKRQRPEQNQQPDGKPALAAAPGLEAGIDSEMLLFRQFA